MFDNRDSGRSSLWSTGLFQDNGVSMVDRLFRLHADSLVPKRLISEPL